VSVSDGQLCYQYKTGTLRGYNVCYYQTMTQERVAGGTDLAAAAAAALVA